MSLEKKLHRLSEAHSPSDAFKDRVRQRMMQRMSAPMLTKLARETNVSEPMAARMRAQVMRRVSLTGVRILPVLRDGFVLGAAHARALRLHIIGRLHPVHVSIFDRSLKWTAAVAVTVLLVRLMPLAFLTSTTEAGSSVEVLPIRGEISVTVAGISVPIDEVYVLSGPALIQTGDGEATIVLHDDGVVRLAPHSAVRIHDLTDRPQPGSGPTLSYVRGQVWMLGLLPLTVDPLSILLPGNERVLLNEGSIAVTNDGNVMSWVYDKHATVERSNEEQFLVAGERMVVHPSVPFQVQQFHTTQYQTQWVADNLKRDAVHRATLAQQQTEKREKLAGILPTSIFYPAKRIAEAVDVFFTVGSDAKAQKRIQQADNRFNEAVALLGEGQEEHATAQMEAYRSTLLTLAGGTGDSLVKFLINKQVNEAASVLATVDPGDEQYALKEAVYDVLATVPDTKLRTEDIEGYVLVDKLGLLTRKLSQSGSLSQALEIYNDIQPYLSALLSDTSDIHPVLKKEAQALLVTASSEIDALQQEEDNADLAAINDQFETYLPQEEIFYEEIRISEEELNAIVQGIVDRIFIYKMSRSRYNQLILEMRKLEGNPNRGSILRRLYSALPERGLARYVAPEMKMLKNELGQ